MPKIELANGVQLRPRSGDVVFAHFLLAHTVASNVCAHIRYALYFRVSVPGMQVNRVYTDVWADWAGMPK